MFFCNGIIEADDELIKNKKNSSVPCVLASCFFWNLSLTPDFLTWCVCVLHVDISETCTSALASLIHMFWTCTHSEKMYSNLRVKHLEGQLNCNLSLPCLAWNLMVLTGQMTCLTVVALKTLPGHCIILSSLKGTGLLRHRTNSIKCGPLFWPFLTACLI